VARVVATQIPVFVASFVLSSYGTGVVMGNPAHDKRDQQLAQAFSIAESRFSSSEGEEAGKEVTSRGTAEGVRLVGGRLALRGHAPPGSPEHENAPRLSPHSVWLLLHPHGGIVCCRSGEPPVPAMAARCGAVRANPAVPRLHGLLMTHVAPRLIPVLMHCSGLWPPRLSSSVTGWCLGSGTGAPPCPLSTAGRAAWSRCLRRTCPSCCPTTPCSPPFPA
jgi:hypothetical protein